MAMIAYQNMTLHFQYLDVFGREHFVWNVAIRHIFGRNFIAIRSIEANENAGRASVRSIKS